MATSEDGSWLSMPGPYRNLIRQLCKADPTLRKRGDGMAVRRGVPWPGCIPRLVVLSVEGESISRDLETTDPDELQQYFEENKSELSVHQCRRIYILEGLSPAFIGVLGAHFMMHPAFFADHNKVSQTMANYRGEENVLPSIAIGKDHVCLKYSELVALPVGVGKESGGVCCAQTGRNLSITRVFGKNSDSSMLSRKCSFWSRSDAQTGSWNTVVLCDPPIRMVYTKTSIGAIHVLGESWGGGYVDFLPQKVQMECLTAPPRTAMLDDLCYYLQNHGHHLNLEDGLESVLFVKKIVACHHARQVQYSTAVIIKVQQMLNTQIDMSSFTITEAELQWTSVHTLGKRILKHCRDLRDTMTQLNLSEKSADDGGAAAGWRDTDADFRFLYEQCQGLQHSADMLNSSITGLTSIVGGRQSFKEQQLAQKVAERSVKEARRARVLVLAGLVFIPLSLTSSLFSMSQPYGPGDDGFWLYFAVSVPFTVLVLFVYYVFDSGTLAALWRLAQRHL